MENKAFANNEKILLLGIFHYALAILLIIIKIVPFHVLEFMQLTEQAYALVLLDCIIMGSILYALSGPLQKSPQQDFRLDSVLFFFCYFCHATLPCFFSLLIDCFFVKFGKNAVQQLMEYSVHHLKKPKW